MSTESLQNSYSKLEVKNSPIEGFGVFATAPISKGDILENIPFVLFPRYTALGKAMYDLMKSSGFLADKEKYYENLRQNLKFKDPEKYYFKWFPSVSFDGDPVTYVVLPLGFGPIYNTANGKNNAGWRITEKTFIFTAERDIAAGEEIRTFYGYFVDELGNIINTDQVMYLGVDKNLEGQPRIYSVRPPNQEVANKLSKGEGYSKLMSYINRSVDGARVTEISIVGADDVEQNKFVFPENSTVNLIYGKIAEYKRTGAPVIRFSIETKSKETNAQEIVQINLRNS